MNNIKKVLLLGSGALKIGEAGEFDYSGSQCLKALKEEGIQTVIINPNIATVQTSEEIADEIYLLPVTPYFVEEVIKKENPDGIMVAFGGQTALNCAVEMYRNNIFEKYNIQVLGTPIQSIIDTEDRDIFIKKLNQIQVKVARSIATESVEEAIEAGKKIGFPLIVRAAYALGGLGSGFADNEKELEELVRKSFNYSNQVLIEESLNSWKEIEYEVVRDNYDNCITVCNMENVDPVGIHTGESIVVAPSQTLSNEEYHMLRTIAIRTIKHLGIVGECNIQYALHPDSLEYRVIEVNARLSRSSALASKATGYPLAFVAAKLALGYGLFELKNSITQTTTAFFEPALDYVVVKMPRWDLEKFYGISRNIGSSMKSVGEVMAIGKSFEEALQKGIRMLDIGYNGFSPLISKEVENLDELLENPNDKRLYAIATAFEQGYSIEKLFNLTKIDPWFLQRLKHIFIISERIKSESEFPRNRVSFPEKNLLEKAKKAGFSDRQIAQLHFGSEKLYLKELEIREYRKSLNILPVVKQIDTLAAEFPAQTNYLYMTYSGTENDLAPEEEKSIAILGSGAYRIGSSVEFDWCGVQAVKSASEEGFKTIVINYNPETVSTDYDVSDRLYFEELSFERVMDILEYERPKGVILSTGGQIPNNIATKLYDHKIPVLGTSPLNIDNAENRHKFSSIMDELGILQPKWKELTTLEAMRSFISEVNYPVLIRPSYVLSGAAMNVVSNDEELEAFLQLAQEVSQDYPVVISEFLMDSKEIELDAVAKDGEIISYALSEHIEFAGVHSGDATMYYPPQKVYVETVRKIKIIGDKIARKFNITGPFNVQFLWKNNELRVIELNLRASRSFPFVSKVSGNNFIKQAMDALFNKDLEHHTAPVVFDMDYVGVKASQFSFTRLGGADPVLSVDMSSTGEVGCMGDDAEEALLKSLLAVGYKIPEKNILISAGPIEVKASLLPAIRILIKNGLTLFTTGGTYKFLLENGIETQKVHWPDKNTEPNVMTLIKEKQVEMVINIPKNLTKVELDNDYIIRRAAVDYNIPLITNARLANAFIQSFNKYKIGDLKIMSIKEYHNRKSNNKFMISPDIKYNKILIR